MKKSTLVERIRYAFDNTMSRGPAGLVLWLALISAALVLGVTAVVWLEGSDPDMGLPEILWNVLFQTITPNPVDSKAGSPIFLGGMLFVTFSSILIVSIFIGILTNAIDHRIQSLRKGRSTVLEHDHILILGWSSQIFTIISELVIANASHKYSCIAILADKDKTEMEDEIRSRVPHPGHTRIVCRTGSPLDLTDLKIASPDTARSIIILAPETSDSDTYVIKTMLALTNNPQRKQEAYHIVAEIHEEKNRQVAKMVGGSEAQLILISELISRIAVQTCLQSGLSIVYTELLNFEGDEIYFKEEPSLVGKTFGDLLCAYDDSAVMGLQTKDGQTLLNPPMDTRIASGDLVIVISEDDTTIKLSGLTNFDLNKSAIRLNRSTLPAPERMLILGWNRHAVSIINGLENYVAPGTQTMIVANVSDAERQLTRYCSGLKRQTVTFEQSETTNRHVLDALEIQNYKHVIVLSYSDSFENQTADAQTLITLLHLRDIRERTSSDFSIVSEMLDVHNRNLAEVARVDDFIVSDQIISLVLAQVSENKYLNAVFADLFDPEGSEIYLKPAEDYVQTGTPINFYTVVESARQRHQVALGYRLKADSRDAAKAYGIVVNPTKSNKVTFCEGDKIIVLAES